MMYNINGVSMIMTRKNSDLIFCSASTKEKLYYLAMIVLKFKILNNIYVAAYIGGGARLWAEGLRTHFNDIDVWLPGYHTKSRSYIDNQLVDGDPDAEIPPRIHNFCRRTATEIFAGIYASSIEHLLNIKLFLNRDKDQKDIYLLKKYLQERS
ncbi:hypothetical protein GF336_05645 [Candidatus Woesearchaeota archaeon]|nr:hypothetical protein [Candidatus Woesearchaeota archaeon]